MKRRTFSFLGALVVALLSSGAEAQVRFRLPLDNGAKGCNFGQSCYVTAYYDLNRSTGARTDWSCRTGSNSRTYDNHQGTDIGIGGFAAMDAGRWVVAAAAGVVTAAHDGEFDRCTSGNCGTANYVVIRHDDGKVSRYFHLKKWSVNVKVGQRVACGALLGKVGSSGRSTGPHLHFQPHATSSSAADDPFKAAGACGGSQSWWVSQGAYRSLPGHTCQ